jgi:type I restriction enzyme R subunit
MSIHKEIHLEDEICADLKAAGWLYDAADASRYNRPQALFVDDAVAWIKASQPKTWEAIEKSHGAAAAKVVAERLRKALDSQGTLAVLRQGFEMVGLKHAVAMCQFKPALAMNADLQARYAANRLRVVRQVHYSVHHENSIDLVLFVNGIPVATAELKSHYTQGVQDAVYQYKTDREPFFKPKNVAEPLLAFPGGALVHFAVSNAAAEMTTRLAGLDTTFLPFNQGNAGGAGNPPNPAGIATDYLWKEVWQRDSFLQILGRYLVPVKNAKKQLVGWIFPRYHQLTVTRKLVAAVTLEGPGNKYLVQHSAGSGKTNSIAWTAHFLADLHDAEDQKVFDTVIVISDRTVLDDQLREAIMSFERTQGVVAVITGEGASKSKELAEALSAGKKIVVCTVQTFPFALEEVRKLAATKSKRFAVIVDEAHSSQSNETAAKLKMVLSAAEMAELIDGGGVSAEDILAAQMAVKAGDDEKAGITYVAFTATPKDKTLQLFGTRPDPTRKPAPDNIPAPFHVYSMRQAIEEGFILDVLKTYTSYKVAFSLAHHGKDGVKGIESKEVDQSEAMKGIMGWVRLHEYNIAQRVQVVVEHYRKHVAGLLGAQAKAMVVTGSRKEAVRWQKATRKYIADHGYKIDTLVAFSGEVVDLDSGPDPFTEHSKELNPKLGGQDIRTAFKGTDYQLLLVANKFQTGFDEPLLCAMYVDKRLGGIQAVQTLSRLNRCYPGKDQTYVVDFVNDPADILAAFKPFYETAELSGVTDPYIVNELKAKLDGQALYDTFEVDRVVNVALKGKRAKPSELDAATTPVASRLLKAYAEAKKAFETAGGDASKEKAAKDTMDSLILFKSDIAAYVRIYGFMSQIFDYGNTDVEKRAIFFRLLHPLLTYGRERDGVDLSALKLTAYTIKSLGDPTLSLGSGEAVKIDPTTDTGGGQVQDKIKVALAELIAKVNDLFEGDLTPGDKLVYVNDVIKGKLMESEKLQEQAANNTKEQFAASPDLANEILGAVMDALTAHTAMSKQALESEQLRDDMKDVLLGAGKLWEGLREKAASAGGQAAQA